jgi:hypothetical protein
LIQAISGFIKEPSRLIIVQEAALIKFFAAWLIALATASIQFAFALPPP